MTSEQKTTLARFLDLTGDYLSGGHARQHEYSFENDKQEFSSLPLAYQIDEEEVSPLAELATAIHACKNCGLGAARTNAVPGEGAENPLVMVIGEGPGADEDRAGRPFVGKAGQLLDRMLESIGLFRDKNCYIANMVKCRPPGNRDPHPDEIAACFPFLQQQIALLRPQIILCAGRVAAQNLLKTNQGINALRGTFSELRLDPAIFPETEKSIPVLCTFHPSAILRDESLKRPAWEDLKLLKTQLGEIK